LKARNFEKAWGFLFLALDGLTTTAVICRQELEVLERLAGMKTLRPLVVMLWLCGVGEVFAAPIRLSYSVVGPTVAGVWMAHETGAFKKYGLDVQLIYISSSGMNIQALLGGSLDVSAPGISGVVLAAARGAPVLTIAAMTNRPPMTLYVQPEITRADQLKGQTLGYLAL
jgi:NitT/TauT family transport system substrate-binding protein